MASRELVLKKGDILTDAILKDVVDMLRTLKFGEVIIKVHNSKIIQVEKTEKTRYDSFFLENGAGI